LATIVYLFHLSANLDVCNGSPLVSKAVLCVRDSQSLRRATLLNKTKTVDTSHWGSFPPRAFLRAEGAPAPGEDSPGVSRSHAVLQPSSIPPGWPSVMQSAAVQAAGVGGVKALLPTETYRFESPVREFLPKESHARLAAPAFRARDRLWTMAQECRTGGILGIYGIFMIFQHFRTQVSGGLLPPLIPIRLLFKVGPPQGTPPPRPLWVRPGGRPNFFVPYFG